MAAHVEHHSVKEIIPSEMGVKALKEYLRSCGQSLAGITEKSELIALAEKCKADDEKTGTIRHLPSQGTPDPEAAAAAAAAAGGGSAPADAASGESGGGGEGFAALLGPSLVTKEGEKPTNELLEGKTNVLLYFSAHWCPP